MSEVKFREFSVAPYSKGLTRWSVVSAPATAVDTDFDGIHPKIINLIEYSALAAKDAELKQVREIGVEMQREVNRKLSLQLDELKKELAEKDAVLEQMERVKFDSGDSIHELERRALLSREVLQKYRKNEG